MNKAGAQKKLPEKVEVGFIEIDDSDLVGLRVRWFLNKADRTSKEPGGWGKASEYGDVKHG